MVLSVLGNVENAFDVGANRSERMLEKWTIT